MKSNVYQEGFLIDLPNSITIETIDKQVLSTFTVFTDFILDVDALSTILTKETDVGEFEIYSLTNVSIQEFMKDVSSMQNDYSAMKSKYFGLICAVVYNASTNTITYLTLEQPWLLSENVFRDDTYRHPSPGSNIYVPLWSYGPVDPGPLSIDPECTQILNEWKTSSDFDIIRKLESSPCMTKENKIRFAAMVLLNYLKILQNNNMNFAASCQSWKGLASNVTNPEFKNVFDDINRICDKVPIEMNDSMDQD
ncbi:MAG: hypothetical protein EOP45_22570, partial [Sphingobacteriaceae bacterium]